jgi:hypothetical protein
MTDLAQRVTIETTQHQALTNVTMNDGNLPLNPNNSSPGKVLVYVSADTSSGTTVPTFASSPNPTTVYTGGLQWSPSSTNSEHAVLVIFVFMTDTTPCPASITYTYSGSGSTLYYTNTWSGQNGTQQVDKQAMCIPYTSNNANYSFSVNFSDSTSHDPQIVVTPL